MTEAQRERLAISELGGSLRGKVGIPHPRVSCWECARIPRDIVDLGPSKGTTRTATN